MPSTRCYVGCVFSSRSEPGVSRSDARSRVTGSVDACILSRTTPNQCWSISEYQCCPNFSHTECHDNTGKYITLFLSFTIVVIGSLIYGPRRKKTCLRGFVNNKGADQPAHLRRLISAFVIPFLYPATKVWRGIMLYPSVSVRPSVRPCSPFPIDNLSIYSRNFFKFCIHIVIGDEWYGIVNGQNPSIFNGVTALFRIGKMVSGLLFLYCS